MRRTGTGGHTDREGREEEAAQKQAQSRGGREQNRRWSVSKSEEACLF